MTDLIKRLREADSYNEKYYALDPLHKEAADRIEELEKELNISRIASVVMADYIQELAQQLLATLAELEGK